MWQAKFMLCESYILVYEMDNKNKSCYYDSQYKCYGKKIKQGSTPRGTAIFYRYDREDFSLEITFDTRYV